MISQWGSHKMDKDSFILKYIYTDGTNLTKMQRIIIMTIFLSLSSIIFLWIYTLKFEKEILEILLGYIFLIVLISNPFIFSEKFDEKYGLHSKIHLGNTFQCFSKILSIYGIAFIPLIIITSNILNKLDVGLIIVFSLIVPIIAAFFRTDVFNDKNCYVGNEIVLGYHPTLYFFPCFLLGLFGYYNSLLLISINLNTAILILIINFIYQILLVTPDYINKCVPFEIRTIKGFLYLIVPLIISYISIVYLLIGEKIFNTLNITLTPAQIIRNIIIISLGLTMGFLFYRQAKQMNKKE